MIKLKEVFRLFGVIIMAFGAVTVCTAFTSYMLDIGAYRAEVTGTVLEMVNAQYNMARIVVGCAGGCLGIIAVIIMIFSIGRYINDNQGSMGILKALGYSSARIAFPFIKYALGVLAGTLLGYGAGTLLTKPVYSEMAENESLVLTFRPIVPIVLVVIPTIVFAFIIYIYVLIRLRSKPLDMIRGVKQYKVNKRTIRAQKKSTDTDYLKNFRSTNAKNHRLLNFFVGVAAFGFSAQFQLSFQMIKMDMSNIAPAICVPVGIMMGVVTLVIAANFIISTNRPYIGLMKAYGYTEKECNGSLLDVYRPYSAIGFLIGTGYQYMLVKLMMSMFEETKDLKVDFNIAGLFITLLIFVVLYEGIMYLYKRQINKIATSECMNVVH